LLRSGKKILRAFKYRHYTYRLSGFVKFSSFNEVTVGANISLKREGERRRRRRGVFLDDDQ